MSEDVTIRECHQFNKDTRAYTEAVEKRHDREIGEVKANCKDETNELKADIKALVDKMINRLPPWVTVVISILTLAVGVLASIAFR